MVELFYVTDAAAAFEDSIDKTTRTSSGDEPPTSLGDFPPVSEPVYLEKNLDHWLRILRYEHDSDATYQAAVAAMTLGGSQPERRDEIAQPLLENFAKIQPGRRVAVSSGLQKLYPGKEYGELIVSFLGETEDLEIQQLVLSLTIGKNYSDPDGLKTIGRWIDNTVFTGSNRDRTLLIRSAREFLIECGYNAETDPSVQTEMRRLLEKATLGPDRAIPAVVWLNEDRPLIAPLNELRVELCKRVLIESDAEPLEVLLAMIALREQIDKGMNIHQLRRDTKFFEALKRRWREWPADQDPHRQVIEIPYPKNSHGRNTYASWWSSRFRRSVKPRLDSDAGLRVFPFLQLMLLVYDLEFQSEFQEELNEVEAASINGFLKVQSVFPPDGRAKVLVLWPDLKIVGLESPDTLDTDAIAELHAKDWYDYFVRMRFLEPRAVTDDNGPRR